MTTRIIILLLLIPAMGLAQQERNRTGAQVEVVDQYLKVPVRLDLPYTTALSLSDSTIKSVSSGWVKRWVNSQGYGTGSGGGSGTVTSVGLTVPSFLSITGSPITTSGTLALSYSGTPLPVTNGGTGVSSPALVAGTNVTITGTWPNQTINASGGGSQTLAQTLALGNTTANNSGIIFNSPGTDSHIQFWNRQTGSNGGVMAIQTTTGNAGSSLQIIPKGTGGAGNKAWLDIAGTDAVAGGANYEILRIAATGTAYDIGSIAGGTGSVRGIHLSSAGTIRMTIGNSGVTINTSTNSFVLPTGRPAGNGYSLTANTDGTTSWTNVAGGSGMTNPMTTAGDIIYGGSSGTPKFAV